MAVTAEPARSASEHAERLHILFASDSANTGGPTPTSSGGSKLKVPGPYSETRPAPLLWQRHLDGEMTLGVASMQTDGTCWWGALDVDDYSIALPDLAARVERTGLPLSVCRTKNGGAHIFAFGEQPVPWGQMELALRRCARDLGLNIKGEASDGKTEILSGTLWMPYGGGDASACYAVKPTGLAMTVGEFLRSAQRLSPSRWKELAEKAEAPTGASAERAQRELTARCRELADMADGAGRNGFLNKVVFRMGVLVGAGQLDGDTTEAMLRRAAAESDRGRGMEVAKIEGMFRRRKKGSSPWERGIAEGRTNPPAQQVPERLVAVRLSDVEPKPVEWLWPDRIAAGKLTLIAGHPGQGKSQTTIDIAARVSRGMRWPLGEGQAPLGSVVMLSVEDDIADTILPRLLAAGGDPARVVVLPMVEGGRSGRRGFDLSSDIAMLKAEIDRIGDVRLLIVDPLSAYLGGKLDSHNNTTVRAVLAPLQDFAAERGIATLGVTHLPKSGGKAVTQVIGSIAFVAAARASFLIAREPEEDGDPELRLFVPIKNNLGNDTTGLAFRIAAKSLPGGIVAPHVVWEDEPETRSADEILSPLSRGGRSAGIEEAVAWLRDALAEGPRRHAELVSEAEGVGIAERTLRTAADSKHLDVIKRKEGFGREGYWVWRLPGQTEMDYGSGGAETSRLP